MRKTSTAQITSRSAQAHLDRQMQAAFAMVRRELDCRSDAELADRCGLSGSYGHYLTLKRSWPITAICQVAAASGRQVSELLTAVKS